MPRIALWNPKKSNDYKFTDRTVGEFFRVSGTAVYCHLYLGTYDQDDPNAAPSVTDIQDVLLLENRDRKYDPNVAVLMGTYTVQDDDFDLKQFGLFSSIGGMFIELHLNDMLAIVGRKIMPGDVIELPHERDDALLDGGKATNKFYVVDDAMRAADGYSATWYPHIWRIKLSPMTNAQEYQDILDSDARDAYGLLTNETLGDLMGMVAADMSLNEAIVDDAVKYVKARNFETRQYWVVPGDVRDGDQYPWVFAGDGVPPDGAALVGSGNRYPDLPQVGDYYLRTDYSPSTLFRFDGSRWLFQEVDYRRGTWSAASRLMTDFLNNTATTQFDDGDIANVKTALSKAVKPQADF